jgi:hypothetical protein
MLPAQDETETDLFLHEIVLRLSSPFSCGYPHPIREREIRHGSPAREADRLRESSIRVALAILLIAALAIFVLM